MSKLSEMIAALGGKRVQKPDSTTIVPKPKQADGDAPADVDNSENPLGDDDGSGPAE